MDAGERRGERPRRAGRGRLLLVALRIAGGGAVGFRVQLVVDRRGGVPRIQQRLAFIEAVLVFHSFARLQREVDALLLERLLLRDDDRRLARAAGRLRRLVQFLDLLADDAERQQP